ncbi:hypothetical protein GCM10008967_12290 [Bacillus carboniphilus]|uniref:DUF4129 domain-containing protein n=1 Tax=Bacillus carboniphilus TaxID=86663 RepID=A0ABP3FS65_9BACI
MTLPIFTPFVKNIFMYLIAVPLGLLAWVFSPILNWIMGFDFSEEIYKDNKSDFFEIMFTTNKTAAETITLSNVLFIGFPFLVAILVLVLIIRKGRMKKKQTVRSNGSIYNGKLVKKNMVKGWVFKQEPAQVVRKQVWQLEKFAVKMKAEREWGETIEEWLDRIEIDINDKAKFTHIYNACRYGEKNISDSDTKWFKERTKLVKQSIKNNKKKYKEKSVKDLKQVDQRPKREKSIMDITTEMNLKRKTGG